VALAIGQRRLKETKQEWKGVEMRGILHGGLVGENIGVKVVVLGCARVHS
jgi:hypothetical protein